MSANRMMTRNHSEPGHARSFRCEHDIESAHLAAPGRATAKWRCDFCMTAWLAAWLTGAFNSHPMSRDLTTNAMRPLAVVIAEALQWRRDNGFDGPVDVILLRELAKAAR